VQRDGAAAGTGGEDLAVRVTVHAGDRIDGLIKGGDGLIEASTATWAVRRPSSGQQHASCEFAAACGVTCRVVELELDCGRATARSLLLHRIEIIVDTGSGKDGQRLEAVSSVSGSGGGMSDRRSAPPVVSPDLNTSLSPSLSPTLSPTSLLRRLDVLDGTAERFGPMMRLRLRKEVRETLTVWSIHHVLICSYFS
jgi:hypothetical protein